MNLHKLIFTENACYKAGRKITVKGKAVVHRDGNIVFHFYGGVEICQ